MKNLENKEGTELPAGLSLKKGQNSGHRTALMPVNVNAYLFFFLCLFLRRRFFRLCVAILCLFLFLPQGIH
jgi:hypothetical protein